MECTFKLVYTSITINIVIEPNILINQLKEKINHIVQSRMSINDNDYEIVIACSSLGEKANCIDLTSTYKFKSLCADTFYIRLIETQEIETQEIETQEIETQEIETQEIDNE